MADRHVEHLLIGGGIAAAAAASALADDGATDVLLVGRELDPPYHRPPASKGYLQGAESRESTLLDLPDTVEVLTRTSVTGLDPAERTATLSTKESVSYDTALIATGAMVRRLQVDGADLDGLHYLRALGNSDAIRRDVEERDRVVLVGGSFIGCEVAASLTALGKTCTIVMQESEPFERIFGLEVARYFRTVLESHGIEVIGEADVEGFLSAADDDERIGQVVLNSGRSIDADVVVLGVGAMPDVMLAKRAGLTIGDSGGVLCDSRLQTSAAGLYAAGDMCEYESLVHGRSLRVEHEDHAQRTGETAGRNMRGADIAHEVVPYFFSDLADWVSLESVGPAIGWADTIVEGDLDSGAFSVLYVDGDRRVLGALSVGGAGDLDDARQRIVSGEPV